MVSTITWRETVTAMGGGAHLVWHRPTLRPAMCIMCVHVPIARQRVVAPLQGQVESWEEQPCSLHHHTVLMADLLAVLRDRTKVDVLGTLAALTFLRFEEATNGATPVCCRTGDRFRESRLMLLKV